MIGIRVDVNRIIATGHIRRCLAIAAHLKSMGQQVLFISADDNCRAFLDGTGFETIVLNSIWDNLESELEALKEIIAKKAVASLLVDSYQVTERYLKELSGVTKVTYFDELYLQGYGCHQIINGVLIPPDYSGYRGRALTGPDYVSLREEFADLPEKPVREELTKVLVTSGGTDNYHFCRHFIENFLKEKSFDNISLTVILGAMAIDKEDLCEQYKENARVQILVNVNNVSSLMLDADYAVTAGGTTLYEICAAGLAGSCFCIADNQSEIVKDFDRSGLVRFGGDYRNHPEETLQTIFAQIREAFPSAYRREKSQRLRSLVDAKGARRIAKALTEIIEL